MLAEYRLTEEERAAQQREAVIVAVRSGHLMATAFHPELTQVRLRVRFGCSILHSGGMPRSPWAACRGAVQMAATAVLLRSPVSLICLPAVLRACAGRAVARALCGDGAAACGGQGGGSGGGPRTRPVCKAGPRAKQAGRPASVLSFREGAPFHAPCSHAILFPALAHMPSSVTHLIRSHATHS